MADPINPKVVPEALLELILRQHPGLTAGEVFAISSRLRLRRPAGTLKLLLRKLKAERLGDAS